MPKESALYHILYIEDERTKYEESTMDIIESVLCDFSLNIKGNKSYYMKENIRWHAVTNYDDAIRLIEERGSDPDYKNRGFDAVICDLKIPLSNSKTELDEKHGLDVLRAINKMDWPSTIIVVSHSATDNKVLNIQQQALSSNEIAFDEWFYKRDFSNPDKISNIKAKLKRILIPVEWIRTCCQDMFTPPIIINNNKMRKILKKMVAIAMTPIPSWPLPKILLLGDPGTGKGILARTYYNLLGLFWPANDRRPFYTINCASLVSEGHGGRAKLFGTRNFYGVPDQRGCFEDATFYLGVNDNDLADKNSQVDYTKAGVVFLDEFVELAPDLQASILNTMEEGVIHREIDIASIPIACHIICATNAKVAEIINTKSEKNKIRRDLVDRIPHLFQLPSISERKEEVVETIKLLASLRHKNINGNDTSFDSIDITDSARRTLYRAINLNLIKSFRQLKAIAELYSNETEISDINLAPVLEKSEYFDIRKNFGPSSSDLNFFEKARMLQLPDELVSEATPVEIIWATSYLYEILIEEKKPDPIKEMHFPNSKHKQKYILLSKFTPQRLRDRLYVESSQNLKTMRFRESQEIIKEYKDFRNTDDTQLSFLLDKL